MVGFTESVITELLHDHSKVWVAMVHMPALNTIQFNWVKSQLPHHPQPVPPIYQPDRCRDVRVAEHPEHLGRPGVHGARQPGRRPAAGPGLHRVRRQQSPQTPGPRSARTCNAPVPATRMRTATRLQGARAQPRDVAEPAPPVGVLGTLPLPAGGRGHPAGSAAAGDSGRRW
jgi:hypothetical protein